MKRGDIYYIKKRHTTGSEIWGSRPGIIVSNDALNATSPVVEVVYLTTRPKKDLPTHVSILSTGNNSTACCEQIDSVSIELIGDSMGFCTAEEMAAIDQALLASLGISVEHPEPVSVDGSELQQKLAGLTRECNFYRDILKELMERRARP